MRVCTEMVARALRARRAQLRCRPARSTAPSQCPARTLGARLSSGTRRGSNSQAPGSLRSQGSRGTGRSNSILKPLSRSRVAGLPATRTPGRRRPPPRSKSTGPPAQSSMKPFARAARRAGRAPDRGFPICLSDQSGRPVAGAGGGSVVCDALFPNDSGETATISLVREGTVVGTVSVPNRRASHPDVPRATEQVEADAALPRNLRMRRDCRRHDRDQAVHVGSRRADAHNRRRPSAGRALRAARSQLRRAVRAASSSAGSSTRIQP